MGEAVKSTLIKYKNAIMVCLYWWLPSSANRCHALCGKHRAPNAQILSRAFCRPHTRLRSPISPTRILSSRPTRKAQHTSNAQSPHGYAVQVYQSSLNRLLGRSLHYGRFSNKVRRSNASGSSKKFDFRQVETANKTEEEVKKSKSRYRIF